MFCAACADGPDQRQRLGLPHVLALLGCLAANGGLDCIKLGDAPERLGRDGRTGRLVHLIQLAPRMSPTRCQLDTAAPTQPFEPGVTVNLNDTSESRQMSSRALCSAVRTVEIDGRRWIGPVPRPVITGVDPEPAGLGAAAAGIEHRDRRVVSEQSLRSEDVFGKPCLQRLQPPDRSANPIGEGRAIQLGALPGEDLALPVKREVVAVL
jgi:hypothetical protein